MNTTIYYLLDEEGRRKSLLAGGNGKRLQKLESDSQQALEMSRIFQNGRSEMYVGFSYLNDGEPRGSIYFDFIIKIDDDGEPHFRQSCEIFEFSELMTVDVLLEWERKRRYDVDFFYKEYRAEFDSLKKEYNKVQEEKKAQREKEEAKERAKIEKREAQKEFEKCLKATERLGWINANGSDYLKLAVSLGYNCQRRYVEERAATELPDFDFEVDFDDEIKYRDRSCPSLDGLQEIVELKKKGFEAKVVWLTCPTSEKYCVDFSSCEAILIENYLGKYNCIKII